MNTIAVVLLLGVAVTTCKGFNDIQDGAKILGNDEINKIAESYSIPIRKKAVEPRRSIAIARRLDGVPLGYDDEEFALLARMKTMEIPPAKDAVNYYSAKYASYPSSSRFHLSRHARSTSGGLKFDDKSSTSGGSAPPRGPSSGSIPSSSQVSFNGDKQGAGGSPPKDLPPTEENKRLFPELFGLSPGYYGGGHYPYHPAAGGLGGLGGLGGFYPGGHYGQGYYPGGGLHHGGYPYHPGGGLGGHGGSSSSAAASASSSSSGGGLHHRPGLYGPGLYGGGGGYYPPGGVAPILGAGYGGPGFIGGGFYRGEDGKGGKDGGKVTGAVISSSSDASGGKVTGGVSFGDK